MSELGMIVALAKSIAFALFVGDPDARHMRCVSLIPPTAQCIRDYGRANCNRVRTQARAQCNDQHRADRRSACMFFANNQNGGAAFCARMK